MLSNAKIIFVPGVKPKPPPDVHRRELLRCLQAGLRCAAPDAYDSLQDKPEQFSLYDWNYAAYAQHRNIQRDLEGIERLLATPVPTDSGS